MIGVDTNVLVYAHREEAVHHAVAAAWLRHLAEGPAPWALPVFAFGEFLRVVTHPKLFERPTPLAMALDFLTAVLESPSVRVLSPGRLYPRLLAECVLGAEARGNLVFDAQIAALCREHGVSRLLTRDRDFHRFAEVQPLLMTAPPG
ncbi:MAG TPA: TA system VapC family ribonuclease toxin [Thermoanaerobaculia bacterium]|nr:TA system VapC family ribonuclease toxin [Thermoanaerobaculia bacterium]